MNTLIKLRRYFQRGVASVSCAFITLFLLSACAGMPPPGSSAGPIPPRGNSMEQMRNTMGLPNAIRFLETGEEVWEYSDRRVGYGAYFAVFERDGRVREVKALRTNEDVARIVPETTTAPQVSQLLGEPAGLKFNGDNPVWLYRLPAGHAMEVEFGPGKVVKRVAQIK